MKQYGGNVMDLNLVRDIINGNETTIDLYFTEKTTDGYCSQVADIANDRNGINVLDFIKGLVLTTVNDLINQNNEIVDYNPTGIDDGTLEITDYDYVNNREEVLESFELADGEQLEENADNLNFYTLVFQNGTDVVRIMRRVSKFKRLYSKGLIVGFRGNQINRIDSKMIGMDGTIDLIDFNNQILILNHVALERIFNLQEKFENTARNTLNKLRNNANIANFDAFEEDCLGDKRIQRILTKMSSEDIDWEHCLEQFENVVDIINTFELNIDYHRVPVDQIVYEDKSQMMDFVRLVRDAYYRTMINNRTGITSKI